MIVYTHLDDKPPADAARRYAEYLERIRAMDFSRSPHLKRCFVLHFFNDGKLARFDYDPGRNTLVLEMESVPTLNDVYNLRAAHGLPREMPHQRADFSYTCTFRGVVYLQIRRMPMQVDYGDGRVVQALAGDGREDDYQHGEILDSPLRQELESAAGVPLFHLRFQTGWEKQVDLIFEKVTVRKLTPVKYESFTEGRRVRLSHLFRG